MRRKYVNKCAILLFVLMIVFSESATAFAEVSKSDISASAEKTGAYICKTVTDPAIGSIGGEWAILGLAQADYPVPDGYFENYYTRVSAELKEKSGELHKVKYTEYSRLILALTALGKDVTNVSGYNLLEKLADYNTLIKQGVNGPVFALLALDSKSYEIPQISGVSVITTRQMLLDYIMEKEFKAVDGTLGGFTLGGDTPDPDVTAMALTALANYKDIPEVSAVIDRAVTALSKAQLASGGFTSKGAENSESAAQVIVALCSLGIDPQTDTRFIKNGNSAFSALQKYLANDGGYKHALDGEVDGMATEQSYCAVVALRRATESKSALYDLSGTGALSVSDKIKVTLDGQEIPFDQPPIITSGRTLVPMRAIFEAFGAEVLWDNSARKVTATLGEKKIELIIGSDTAMVNGEVKTLDVPAQIASGRTLVPVRFIAESLEAEVTWDQASKTVKIVRK